MELDDIQSGMIFKDNDKRMGDRHVLIVHVNRLGKVITYVNYNIHDRTRASSNLRRSTNPKRFSRAKKATGFTYAGADTR